MQLAKRLNLVAAMVDQVWLSLLSFVVSIAFIWSASKEEFGYYLLLIAPLLLVQSIQNALVNSPLATFLPKADAQARPHLRATAISMHAYLAVAAAILGGLGLLVYGWLAHVPIGVLLLAGFVLAIVGVVAREAQRSFAYVQGMGFAALRSDLVYGSILLVGLGFAVASSSLSASVALGLTGMAGIVLLISKLRSFAGLTAHSQSLKQFWTCGRWALPSVIVTWVSLSAYPYFAGRSLGLEAVADIGAARLLLMPVGLMMTAWGNWYRPRISGWIDSGNTDAIERVTRLSVFAGLAGLALLASLLFAIYPMLESFLDPQYRGLLPLVLMWTLFFALSLVRNVYMATLMTDAEGYKTLHHITWLAFAIALPGFVVFSSHGALWVIGVLCLVELVQSVIVVIKARGYWRRSREMERASCCS